MKTTIRAAAVVAAALLLATAAAAQESPAISLTPADPAHWDLAAHVAWFGSNKSDIGPEWDRWYSAAAGGVTIGHYWTPHLKTEIQGTFSREGRIYAQEPVPLAVGPFPYVVAIPARNVFQATTVNAGVAYQFFENEWFHPFVGAGLEVVRERHRVDFPRQIVPIRPPAAPQQIIPGSPQQIIPATRGIDEVSFAARPFVNAGFKLYFAERAFLRSDLRTAISNQGLAHVVWGAGIGVDF